MVSKLMLRKTRGKLLALNVLPCSAELPTLKNKLLISIEKIESAPHIINQVSCSVQSIPYLNREELLYDNEPAI